MHTAWIRCRKQGQHLPFRREQLLLRPGPGELTRAPDAALLPCGCASDAARGGDHHVAEPLKAFKSMGKHLIPPKNHHNHVVHDLFSLVQAQKSQGMPRSWILRAVAKLFLHLRKGLRFIYTTRSKATLESSVGWGPAQVPEILDESGRAIFKDYSFRLGRSVPERHRFDWFQGLGYKMLAASLPTVAIIRGSQWFS